MPNACIRNRLSAKQHQSSSHSLAGSGGWNLQDGEGTQREQGKEGDRGELKGESFVLALIFPTSIPAFDNSVKSELI